MINLTKIIAAVLVLLAIALGVYAWMLSRQPVAPVRPAATASAPDKAAQAQTYPVVIATRALPAGQVIPAEALRVERLTINPAGAFQETAPLEGRVPVIDLSEGTPLIEGQLVSGLALRVAEGERAIAIKADEVMGVGNKVQPGDFVDVFVMLKSDGRDVDRSQARLLLSRKRVLAFGTASVDGLPSKADKTAAAQQQRAEAARTAVLAVPVDDVNRLTLGENSGRLLLALRNPTDMSVGLRRASSRRPLFSPSVRRLTSSTGTASTAVRAASARCCWAAAVLSALDGSPSTEAVPNASTRLRDSSRRAWLRSTSLPSDLSITKTSTKSPGWTLLPTPITSSALMAIARSPSATRSARPDTSWPSMSGVPSLRSMTGTRPSSGAVSWKAPAGLMVRRSTRSASAGITCPAGSARVAITTG